MYKYLSLKRLNVLESDVFATKMICSSGIKEVGNRSTQRIQTTERQLPTSNSIPHLSQPKPEHLRLKEKQQPCRLLLPSQESNSEKRSSANIHSFSSYTHPQRGSCFHLGFGTAGSTPTFCSIKFVTIYFLCS